MSGGGTRRRPALCGCLLCSVLHSVPPVHSAISCPLSPPSRRPPRSSPACAGVNWSTVNFTSCATALTPEDSECPGECEAALVQLPAACADTVLLRNATATEADALLVDLCLN